MNRFVTDFSLALNKGRPIAKITTATRNGICNDDFLGIKCIEGIDKESKPVKKNFEVDAGIQRVCMLTPTPDPGMKKRNQRDVYYVSAPSGAGKSTFCGEYMRNYHETFPDDTIVVFSAVPDDPAFKGIPLLRIKLDDEFRDNQINETEDMIKIDDLQDCLVLFDDIDVIHDVTTRKIVQAMRNQALEIGRHWNISMLCTSHQLMNYKETKILLMEATRVVVFPKSGSGAQIKRYLKTYGDLDKHQIKRVFDLRSTWICFGKSCPQFILHVGGAYLL